jgi:hypothetical protein
MLLGNVIPIPFNPYLSGGGGLPTSLIEGLVFWLDYTVEDAEYPNKIGDQERTAFTGRALTFDGATQTSYVVDNCGLCITQATTDFCMTAKFSAGVSANTEYVCGKGIAAATPGRYMFYKNPTNQIKVYCQPTGGAIDIDTGIDGDVDSDEHLFVLRIDITNSKVYVYTDGVLQNVGGTSYTGSFPVLDNKYKFFLGGGQDTNGDPFNYYTGTIHDVRVYHKDITSAANLASLEKGEQLEDELAWYWCESTDLYENFDASGNGYHLTNVGFDSGSFSEGNWQSLTNKYGYGINVSSNVDIVVNGDFATDTDWTKQAGWTIAGGVAVGTAVSGYISQSILTVGRYYETQYDVLNYSSGTVNSACGSNGGVSRNSNGTYTDIVLCVGSTSLFIDGIAFTGEIDNVSAQLYFMEAIPPDMSTTVNGIPTHDIFGNELTYAGQAKYPAIARDRSCFVGDGVAYWDMSSTVVIDPDSDLFEIEFGVDLGIRDANYSVPIRATSTADGRVMFNNGNFIFADDSNNTLTAWTNLKAAITDDSYQVVKFVGNGSDIKSYHDGVLMDTLSAATLTDVMTLTRAMTDSNASGGAQSWYHAKFVRISLNGVDQANWQFVEGNGSTVYDVVGTNHLTGVGVDNNNWGVIDEPTEDYLAEHGGNFVGKFNGVDDYIDLDSTITIDYTADTSILFRMKMDSIGTTHLIAGNASDAKNWIVFLSGGNIRIESDINGDIATTSVAALTDTDWHNYEVRINNGIVSALKDDVSLSMSDDTIAANLILSRIAAAATLYFLNGQFDYFKIKNNTTGLYLYEYNITGIDSEDTFGTWSGTGEHTAIIPARKDTNVDALGQTLVYGQNGKQLIPHTYMSMPENVRELYDADQAERYEGGLMDEGKGTFNLETGGELLSATGFDDPEDDYENSGANWSFVDGVAYVDETQGAGNLFWSNPHPIVVGKRYRCVINFTSSDGGVFLLSDGATASVSIVPTVGENVIYFTGAGTLNWYVRGSSAFTGSLTSISLEEVLNDSDTESWVAYGTNTIENDGNALKITYVDDSTGAFVLLRATSDINTDLIIGDTYKLIVRAKVNTGSSVRIIVIGPNTVIGTVTSDGYLYFEEEFVATSVNANYIRTDNMGVGEIIWIDRWELFHKTTQTGNNLIANGGARNEIGALTTTDWDDSNSDGLADGFSPLAGNTNSIVTGNGFSGNAQRTVNDGTSKLRFDSLTVKTIAGAQIYIKMKYRTNRSDVSWGNGIGGAILPVATGNAIEYEEIIDTPTSYSAIRFRLACAAALATNGDYIELDEFEIRHVIDGEFYEPEALGATPVIVGINYLLANPWRYLTRYLNSTDRTDLMLFAEDAVLDYDDHLKILKFVKEN